MKFFFYLQFICFVFILVACQSRNQMQVSEKEERKVLLTNDTILKSQTEDTTIYYQPDIIASFKGGEAARVQFFKDHMKMPDNLVKGKHDIAVFFQFVVEKDGSITNIKKMKGVNEACDKEAFRLLKMIEWEPATINGEKVRSSFLFPVIFYKAND